MANEHVQGSSTLIEVSLIKQAQINYNNEVPLFAIKLANQMKISDVSMDAVKQAPSYTIKSINESKFLEALYKALQMFILLIQ